MTICPTEYCTGCFACVNVCAIGCITMTEDAFGEWHPHIDTTRCVECGLCQKVCPNNRTLTFAYPIKCLAAWNKNHTDRAKSASGGIGKKVADFTINIREGVFVSIEYDSDFTPIQTFATKGKDTSVYQGSKYIHSKVGDNTFRQVKHLLNEGKLVVYLSTPCQVAGLATYLGKDYPNLLTIDLMCHGVSPVRYFQEELHRIKTTHHLQSITDVRFRDNEGHNFRTTLWNGKQLLLNLSGRRDYYFAGFLFGVSLRENCYDCRYARPERIADITLGDFIGLGTEKPFDYSTDNVSAVLINTQKGERFFAQLQQAYPTIQVEERNYSERLAIHNSLRKSTPRPKCRNLFRKLVACRGFSFAIRCVIGWRVLKTTCWEYLRRFKQIYRLK